MRIRIIGDRAGGSVGFERHQRETHLLLGDKTASPEFPAAEVCAANRSMMSRNVTGPPRLAGHGAGGA